MGGLVDSIFGGGGGKAAKESLKFQQGMWADTKGYLDPYAKGGAGAFGDAMAFLRGGPEQEAAFKGWLDSSDYKFAQEQGNDALTSSAASRGLRTSGATDKARIDFGQKLGMSYRDNYFNKLMGGAQLGAGAASSLAGAGGNMAALQANTAQAGAQSKSNSFNSFLNFGLGVAGMFSDRRLKTDAKRVGRLDDGTPVYTYRYKDGGETQMGVMADEAPKRTLGPRVNGFQTLDLARI